MTEQYFTKSPKSAYKEYEIRAIVRGIPLRLKSATGIFSAKEIDRGTRLLIEKAELPEEGNILDLGCGYGVVGIVAAKTCPKAKIVMTDINNRAVKVAEKNLKINKIKNAEVRQGNIYEPVKEEKFDTILLNPPMAAGKKICMEMIEQAPKHLKPGGTFQFVARHRKGGETLFAEMQKLFKDTKFLAIKGGFRIYYGTALLA